MGMENSKIRPGRSEASVASGADVCIARGDITLRAATDADTDFLRDVFISTRMDEFVGGGMPVEQAETLLASQFSVQHAYYHRHYPHARFDIVVRSEQDIGRLYHDWSGDMARLIDIALLPAYRGAGIGTRLMHAIVAEAARKNMPMQLYVEFNNPVRALYRRLGFMPAGENGVYEMMRRDALPLGDEEAALSLQDLNKPFR